MHVYRGPAARLAWQVTWRETYLTRLPAYQHYTGTTHPAFGFAAQLAHLTDLNWATPDSVSTADPAEAASPPISLQIDAHAATPAPQKPRDKVILPTPDTAALVSQGVRQTARSLAWLRQTAPWITKTAITPALLQRAVSPDAYIVARRDKSDLFDTLFAVDDATDLYICGQPLGRSAAKARAKMLQASFIHLNRKAERFRLVEDIRLRRDSDRFAPDRATIILPGWTARTSRAGYRRYVEDMILRLAPAHVYVQPLWVDFATMQRLTPLLDDYDRTAGDAATEAGKDLRQALQTLQEGQTA